MIVMTVPTRIAIEKLNAASVNIGATGSDPNPTAKPIRSTARPIPIGAPIAVRYRRAGVALVVGVSLVVFCAYYVSLIGGEHLADREHLSPFWAMWAPNALFGIVGFVAFFQARRAGG